MAAQDDDLRPQLRFVGVLLLASVRLGVVMVGGLALVTVAVLGCDDACTTAGDWSTRASAWQWNALLALALGISLAGLVSLYGVLRRRAATVASALACECAFVAGTIGLLAWGRRLDAAPAAIAVGVAVELAGLA
ncbi:MAG: hypothetical protein R3C15_21410 [Thermoleophilia bacterium]